MSREEFSQYAAEKRPWFSFYEEVVDRAFASAQKHSEAGDQTQLLLRVA